MGERVKNLINVTTVAWVAAVAQVNPWPRSFHVPQLWQKKKKKEKQKCAGLLFSAVDAKLYEGRGVSCLTDIPES